jgi:ATP-dependent Lon protease
MRRVAKHIATEEEYEKVITTEEVHEILGPEKFDKSLYTEEHIPGVAVGLAWTPVGGDILFIEATLSKGNGGLTLTGNLGEVMKESAMTAMTFLKANAKRYGINPDIFSKVQVHLHFPEGGIPKDGPSAGITILTALASLFTQKRVKPFMAMTGEITLRGKVMPVGGIKEKILAAKRAGIKDIIIGENNRKNVDEIEKSYIKGLKFHFVKTMDEVLHNALLPNSIKNPVDMDAFLKAAPVQPVPEAVGQYK